MTYLISGLAPDEFGPLFAADDATLAARRARRIVADADHGFPCRVSLEDAKAGETLLLLNFASHDVETPFRSSFAIYIRECAKTRATFVDSTPPVFAGRQLSLRGFGADAMLLDARLAAPNEADTVIRALFGDPRIAYIHAHNAVYGCFSARIDRYEGPS